MMDADSNSFNDVTGNFTYIDHVNPDGSVSKIALVGNDLNYRDYPTIGCGVSIGNNVVIGKRATIGNNVSIADNVEIYESAVIGRNSILDYGACIGSRGVVGSDSYVAKNQTISVDFDKLFEQ